MDEVAIGANIRRIRLARKTSLTELAGRVGIAKGTLSKIENGQISSPISTLLSILTMPLFCVALQTIYGV